MAANLSELTLILSVSNVVWIMAFNSQTIGRHVQGLTNPNVVGTVYFDDADKLHSDLIDLDIRVKEANRDEKREKEMKERNIKKEEKDNKREQKN